MRLNLLRMGEPKGRLDRQCGKLRPILVFVGCRDSGAMFRYVRGVSLVRWCTWGCGG